jgi:hypothetical protein
MTRVILLERLRDETRDAVKNLPLPVRKQAEGEIVVPRPAEVHLMRLPDSRAAKKKAPYIIHQVITGKDAQPEGTRGSATVDVRSVFCVYDDDEESGGLALLGLMERVRIRFLEKVIIGGQFQLDVSEGIEAVIYPDDSAPYYAGEMISTWIIPYVQRKVVFTDG